MHLAGSPPFAALQSTKALFAALHAVPKCRDLQSSRWRDRPRVATQSINRVIYASPRRSWPCLSTARAQTAWSVSRRPARKQAPETYAAVSTAEPRLSSGVSEATLYASAIFTAERDGRRGVRHDEHKSPVSSAKTGSKCSECVVMGAVRRGPELGTGTRRRDGATRRPRAAPILRLRRRGKRPSSHGAVRPVEQMLQQGAGEPSGMDAVHRCRWPWARDCNKRRPPGRLGRPGQHSSSPPIGIGARG